MRERRRQQARTEPAIRGLRLLLLAALMLAAGCTATPEPGPGSLVDRSVDTSYRLDEIAEKLEQARGVQLEGNRKLAVAVFDTARSMLPEDHARERHYVNVLKAGVWAGAGEGRDADKVEALLKDVERYARQRRDLRLLSDVVQIRAVSALAGDALQDATQHAQMALAYLWNCEAYREYVETAGELAFEFLSADRGEQAEDFARKGHEAAQRLDEWAVMRAGMDAAMVVIATARERDGVREADEFFLEAYEASYLLNEMGWRDIVIASAVESFYDAGAFRRAVQWGDRMRNRTRGLLPHVEEARLWPEDYLAFLSQYAFAMDETGENEKREQEARNLALEIIDEMPGEARESYRGLEEKLRNGLLHPDGEK